jgi:hypothetical protein
VQLLPPPLSILYASSLTQLVTTARPTRRWLLRAGGGYQMAGGVDQQSRVTLPFQQGPRAEAAAEYSVTRTDAEITNASFYGSTFTAGPCIASTDPVCEPIDEVPSIAEGWRHAFARTVDATLLVGATAVRSRQHDYDAWRVRGYPTADLIVARHVAGATTSQEQAAGGAARERHLHPEELELMAELRLAPVVDYRTGIADQRAQALAIGSYTVERTTIHVTLGFAQSVPVSDAGAATFLRGEVEIAYRATPRIDVGGGVRGAWQTQPPFGAFFTEGAFVALTWHQAALSL